MPATFGGQLTLLVSLFTLVTLTIGVSKSIRAHNEEERKKHEEDAKHREWLELLWIDLSRRMGYPLSRELIEKHMLINGNADKSSSEKDRIYGEDRPRNHDSGELDSHGKPGRKEKKW